MPVAMADGCISIADMDELLNACEAVPLFPEFDVGPVWYHGGWWVVPNDASAEQGYHLADNPTQTLLGEEFLRLERSAVVAADIAAERARDERLGESEPHLDVPGSAYLGQRGATDGWPW